MLKIVSILLLAAVVCATACEGAPFGRTKIAGGEGDDRTLSPYFFVRSDDPSLDRLPLKSTSAVAHITGVVADVRVTQVYRNEGKRAIEAIYVFPASTKAAVYGMKMTIGTRTITARIREREQARQEYEQARQQGKSASLLEQQRPNVFQMNVANILPGDEIRVELRYTELLTPTDGVYEFMYPTVVGPRYSNQPAATASSADTWTRTPYHHGGDAPASSFDLGARIESGIPIKEIDSPSHKVSIAYKGPASATVRLSGSEKAGGNRDFILRYRLAGGAIESGLLLSKGDKENFFLLMLEPPKRVSVAQIPPREYIFIVDVSGSMHGFPLEISKKLLQDLIGKLRPTDRFNVLLFSGGASLMSDTSLPATQENISRALNVIDRQQGGGGTELLPAMKRALAIPRMDGFSRTLVIATDGYVSVEAETFDLIRKNLGDANMFAFGIGTGVNRFLMEGIARAGMGEPFIITRQEEAAAKARKFREYIQSPVLSRVRVDFGGFNAYGTEPPSVPDVLAERPVIIFGKWRGPLKGALTVSGLAGDRRYEKKIDVNSARMLEGNDALRYLWARHRIATLADCESIGHRDERVKEITSLGISYNLLTRYTSFVAIDSQVRNTGGGSTTVQQPLPLPEGVSDLAVGGAMGAPRMKKAMKHMMSYAAPAAAPVEMRSKEEKAAPEDQPFQAQAASVKVGTVTPDLKGLLRDGVRAKDEAVAREDFWRSYRVELTAVYRNYLARHPGVHGTLTIRLVIGADGRVRGAEIVSTNLKQPALVNELLERAKKWSFPASGVKKESVLTVPLILSS